MPSIDQSLVIQGLEGPQHALHVPGLECLVVVIEVDPAGLPGDVVLPLVGELQHRGSAGRVELLDAQFLDVGLGLQPELGHRLQLGGQSVAVPAEAPLDAPAAHRLVARHDVLDVAGQQVPVVRQAVGERRAVVEDELVGPVLPGRVAGDRRLEGLVGLPEGQHPFLDRGEARARGNRGGLLRQAQDGAFDRLRARPLRVDHGDGPSLVARPTSIHEDDVSTAVPPRLPGPPRFRDTIRPLVRGL